MSADQGAPELQGEAEGESEPRAALTDGDPPPGAWAALQAATARALAWVEALAEGERWIARTTLAALLLVLICSFPRADALWRAGSAPEWGPLLTQLEHPLTPQPELDPSSHGAKTAFRLSMPLLGYALGLGPLGLRLFELLCGLVLFAAFARAAAAASGDRTCAVLTTLLVAACFPGITAFVEHRGMFDGVALCGLTLACAARNPLGVLAGLSLAHWTDERAVLATGLVLLVHLTAAPRAQGLRRALDARVVACVVSVGLYAGLRLGLGQLYGLHTPRAGTGLAFLVNQLNNLPLGLWTGLEGGWLLVLAAGVALWRGRRLGLLLWALLATGVVTLTAFLVWDITRSLAYLLPVLLLALRILREREPARDLRTLCRWAFLLSLLWPNYYVAGKGESTWNYPLPLRLLRYLRAD